MAYKIIKDENVETKSRKRKKKMPIRQVVAIALVAITLSSTVLGAAVSYGIAAFRTFSDEPIEIVYATDSDATHYDGDGHDHDHN